MDALRPLVERRGWHAPDLETMVRAGWTTARLSTLNGSNREEFEQLVADMKEWDEQFTLEWSELEIMAGEAYFQETGTRMTHSKRSAAEWIQAHLEHQRDSRRRLHERWAEEKIAKELPRKGKATLARWPTRLERRLEAAGGDQGMREKAEKTERERWTRALLAQIYLAGLPVAQGQEDSEGFTLSRVSKGRRGSTLRKHVKTWDKMAQWLCATFKICWPTHPHQVADYLEARISEPCAKSTPVGIYKTFMFMEFAGEVEPEMQMHRSPCIQNALEQARVRLEQVDLKSRRQAATLLVKVVEAMERTVCDPEESVGHEIS